MAEVSQSTVSARRGGGLIRRTVRGVAIFAVALVVASAAVVSTGVLPASAASTGPGSVDTTFNPGGSGTNSQVSSVAVQSDGRILIGGAFTTYNGISVSAGLARLNADGSLDTSFNAGGAGVNQPVQAVAVQSDGKVLIGGQFTKYNGTSVGRIARLNADGSLDSSFNSGGAGAYGTVYSVTVQPDGKILIGGYFSKYNNAAVGRMARLNADGSVDTSFNPGGSGANSQVRSMALESDGKILVGGMFSSYNGTVAGGVFRANSDGSADTGFNSGGIGADNVVYSVAAQSDGKVLIGGSFTNYNGTQAIHLARANSDGSVDASFNSGGVGANNDVNSVAVLSDGKVLIGGLFTSYNGSSVGYVARLNADGSLDAMFNSGGAGASNSVYSVGVQSDGKVLIGGLFTGYNGASVGRIARLNASAAAHTVSFDANGGAGSMASQSASSAAALTANSFSRSGYTFTGWNTTANGSGTAYADGASFPFTADATLYAQWAAVSSTGPGSLDTSFNAGGAGANNIVSSVVVRPDGKVLIAGAFTSYDGTSVGSVARLNADGSLDTSFNSGGAGADDAVYSVVVQSDRKILISGAFTSYDGTSVGHVARLNADGSLDTSFNSGGAGTDGKVSSVVVQSDGKVLICGQFSRYNGISVGSIARLNADGSLDTSFNTAGAGANNEVNSAGVQSDGKILIGGWFTRYNGTSVGYVARLNADGSLDASFNSGGVGAGSGVYSVVVQSDGKVLIGGFFAGYNGTSAGRVARLNADGSLDVSFNSGGAGASGQVYSVALQSDGKVLIGGLFTSYNGASAGDVARLNADGSWMRASTRVELERTTWSPRWRCSRMARF